MIEIEKISWRQQFYQFRHRYNFLQIRINPKPRSKSKNHRVESTKINHPSQQVLWFTHKKNLYIYIYIPYPNPIITFRYFKKWRKVTVTKIANLKQIKQFFCSSAANNHQKLNFAFLHHKLKTILKSNT